MVKETVKIDIKQVEERYSWDEYFMELVDTIAQRTTCNMGRFGCVVTKDNRILTKGYTDAPMGAKHCDDVGHEMHKIIDEDGVECVHCIRTIHAEQNALIQAARVGISLQGGTLYCTMTPCYTCAKLIINAGIVRVVIQDREIITKSKNLFKENKVKLDILNNKKI